MTGMRYVWKITARGDQGSTEHLPCYAYAGSMREALELAGEPDALATPEVGREWQSFMDNQRVWRESY